jgi:hypothetical protein
MTAEDGSARATEGTLAVAVSKAIALSILNLFTTISCSASGRSAPGRRRLDDRLFTVRLAAPVSEVASCSSAEQIYAVTA